MKVCFISPYASRGGAELSLVELLDALAPLGIQCCCVVPNEGEFTELLHERDIETLVVPFKPWVHANRGPLRRILKAAPHRQIGSLLRLRQAIRRTSSDIVYTNSVAVGAGAMAAKLLGLPHVWHMREFGYDDYRLSFDLGRHFSRVLIRKLTTICIANSQAVSCAYASDLRGKPIRVIYNAAEVSGSGADTAIPSDHYWRNPGSIRCILPGKYMPGKGQEDALKAMLCLRAMNVPAELLLVGETLDTEYRCFIESFVNQNDLADTVTILDHQKNPAPIMASADVVLMCSKREAFGRVTVEAMKLGKPVIGTHSGGTPEIVEDGETGFLYPPGDWNLLAERIAGFYHNPGLKRRMGRLASQQAYQRFNVDKYGLQVLAVLQDVMSLQSTERTHQESDIISIRLPREHGFADGTVGEHRGKDGMTTAPIVTTADVTMDPSPRYSDTH